MEAVDWASGVELKALNEAALLVAAGAADDEAGGACAPGGRKPPATRTRTCNLHHAGWVLWCVGSNR